MLGVSLSNIFLDDLLLLIMKAFLHNYVDDNVSFPTCSTDFASLIEFRSQK